MKTNLGLLGLDNLIYNVYRALNGKIQKEKHKLRKKSKKSKMSDWLLYTKFKHKV